MSDESALEAFPPRSRPVSVPWVCPTCGYTMNFDKDGRSCVNCGRDFLGRPGRAPKVEDKPHRPGLRGA